MREENTKKIKKFHIGKYYGEIYDFENGPSKSDVGKYNGNLRNRIIMSIMASMFNRSNPKLKLNYKNFIPKRSSLDYEKISLNGYIAVLNLDEEVKLVLYGNGATIKDKGKKVDYSRLLKKDIFRAFKHVEIKKESN